MWRPQAGTLSVVTVLEDGDGAAPDAPPIGSSAVAGLKHCIKLCVPGRGRHTGRSYCQLLLHPHAVPAPQITEWGAPTHPTHHTPTTATHPPHLSQQDIGCLDVAMDAVLRVKVHQGAQHLAGGGQGRQGPGADGIGVLGASGSWAAGQPQAGSSGLVRELQRQVQRLRPPAAPAPARPAAPGPAARTCRMMYAMQASGSGSPPRLLAHLRGPWDGRGGGGSGWVSGLFC